jgi:hypothetical protein
LFDPLHNTEFRRKLDHVTDPQINSHRLDQQDVILAETEVRIKSLLGLDTRASRCLDTSGGDGWKVRHLDFSAW